MPVSWMSCWGNLDLPLAIRLVSLEVKGPAFSQLSDLPLPRLAHLCFWLLVARIVVTLPTCLPCELKAWVSVLVVPASYSLHCSKINQFFTFPVVYRRAVQTHTNSDLFRGTGRFPRNRGTLTSAVCPPGKFLREAVDLFWTTNN